MSLFWVIRVKQFCFLSLEDCGINGDPTSPLVFQGTQGRTRVPIPPESLYFSRLKSTVPPTQLWRSKACISTCPLLRASRDGDELEWARPSSGTAGHSRDMGPTCEHVVELVDSILQQAMSTSLGCCIFVTMDLHWSSHRAE